MIKALISIASVTAIALSGLAYAETNPAKDNKILGFVQRNPAGIPCIHTGEECGSKTPTLFF